MSLASILVGEVVLVLLEAWFHCAIPLYHPSQPEDVQCHRHAWGRDAQRYMLVNPRDPAAITPYATYDPQREFWHYTNKRLDRGLVWQWRPKVLASMFGSGDIARVRQGAWLSHGLDRRVRLLQLGALPDRSPEDDARLGRDWMAKYLREPRQVRWRKWRRSAPALEGIVLARTEEQILVLSTLQIDWLGSTDRSLTPPTRMLMYVQPILQNSFAWVPYPDPQDFAFDPVLNPWNYPRSAAIVVAWVSKADLLPADVPPAVPSLLMREFDGDPHPPGYVGHGDRAPWTYISGPERWCHFGLWPPIARSWVPAATPLFSIDGKWFGLAAGVFLLGHEVQSPHPLLACHDVYYSVLQTVCVPRFLRAPRCARGW